MKAGDVVEWSDQLGAIRAVVTVVWPGRVQVAVSRGPGSEPNKIWFDGPEVDRLRVVTPGHQSQSKDDRIVELERALHEALNWWSADVPGDDKNRDRLRSIADKGTVTP